MSNIKQTAHQQSVIYLKDELSINSAMHDL